jgi:hypothetical protein
MGGVRGRVKQFKHPHLTSPISRMMLPKKVSLRDPEADLLGSLHSGKGEVINKDYRNNDSKHISGIII